MTWAPRGILSTTSARVGRSTRKARPVEPATVDPSGAPDRRRRGPGCRRGCGSMAPADQGQQVAALLGVDEQDPLAGGQRPTRAGAPTGVRCPRARARRGRAGSPVALARPRPAPRPRRRRRRRRARRRTRGSDRARASQAQCSPPGRAAARRAPRRPEEAVHVGLRAAGSRRRPSAAGPGAGRPGRPGSPPPGPPRRRSSQIWGTAARGRLPSPTTWENAASRSSR